MSASNPVLLQDQSSELLDELGEEFPVDRLAKLDEQLNRPKWVVPVRPRDDLEMLIRYAIKFCKESECGSVFKYIQICLQVSISMSVQVWVCNFIILCIYIERASFWVYHSGSFFVCVFINIFDLYSSYHHSLCLPCLYSHAG